MDADTIELGIRATPGDRAQILPLENSEPPNSDTYNFSQRQEFSLSPVDGGRDAWLFLAAAFMVETLVWGFPFAYGVFQEHYSTHAPFAGSRNIAVIGTCAMGVMYLSAPLVFDLLQRFPKIQRPAIGAGLVTMCLGLGLSSLSETTTHLIITQGVFYAIGGSLVYSPTILFMNEWFILSKHGFRTTLRVWVIVLFICIAPLTYFLKPRLPLSQSSHTRRFDLSFLTSRAFLLLQTGNVIEGLGYFVPSIYLPTYALTLGASTALSALTVIIFNVASVFGCVFMGTIIDKYHVTTCILLSTIGSTIGVFVIWGLASSLPVLFAFCIVYGLFAGCFTSTYPGVMHTVQREKASVDPCMVFACLAAGRGIGNVACGPLSEALVRSRVWMGEAGGAYGSGYGSLVVFTGLTAMLGGVSILGRRVGWM